MFQALMLAIITLSSLNPCFASPLQIRGKSVSKTDDAIWNPSAGASWNYQLIGKINLGLSAVDVWDIDLFDADSATIDSIHARGKHVICYFSAGSSEDWRSDDAKFEASDKGNALKSWKGENWLQTKSTNVRNVMLARLDLAQQKKCDGVDPDNVDAYNDSNGLGLTEDDAVDYVTFLTDGAHSRNMAIGLKNSASIVSRLVSKVEYSVQESCLQYNDCAEFQPFIEQNKPVFHVEYMEDGVEKRNGGDVGAEHSGEDKSTGEAFEMDDTGNREVETKSAVSRSAHCSAKVAGFSNIMKNMDLGAWLQLCF